MQFKLLSYRILRESLINREYEMVISRSPTIKESISDLFNKTLPKPRIESFVGDGFGWKKLPKFTRVDCIGELDEWLDSLYAMLEFEIKKPSFNTTPYIQVEDSEPIKDILQEAKQLLKRHGY